MDIVLALQPVAPGLIPGVPKNFSKELFLWNYSFLMLPSLIDDAAALSGGQQRISNVYRTHLILWVVASWYYKKYALFSVVTHSKKCS